jgi:hypothetical protein
MLTARPRHLTRCMAFLRISRAPGAALSQDSCCSGHRKSPINLYGHDGRSAQRANINSKPLLKLRSWLVRLRARRLRLQLSRKLSSCSSSTHCSASTMVHVSICRPCFSVCLLAELTSTRSADGDNLYIARHFQTGGLYQVRMSHSCRCRLGQTPKGESLGTGNHCQSRCTQRRTDCCYHSKETGCVPIRHNVKYRSSVLLS